MRFVLSSTVEPDSLKVYPYQKCYAKNEPITITCTKPFEVDNITT